MIETRPAGCTATPGSPLRVSTQATGYLLTSRGFLTFTGILCLAVWFGQEGIAVLASLILASALLSWGWSRVSLAGVRAQFLFGERRAFPGDVLHGRFRIVNRKPLPLSWIEVEQKLPKGLISAVSPCAAGEGTLQYAASVRWYQALHWTVALTCTRRGYFPFPSLIMTSGDPFGFYARSAVVPPDKPILVYPRLVPLSEIGIPCCYPMGDMRTENRLFPDPTRTVGVRDYRPQDPFRSIHWKASARQRKLHVKVFEAATTRKIALFVAADSFAADGNDPEGDFEFALSVAASVAHDAIGKGAAVGLFLNARLAVSRQPAAIGPGGGHASLMAILEALAKATPKPSGPFADFAGEQIRTLSAGTTIMLVLARPPETILALAEGFRQAGFPLVIIQVGQVGQVGQIGGDDTHVLSARIPRYRIDRPPAADADRRPTDAANGGGSSGNRKQTSAVGGEHPR